MPPSGERARVVGFFFNHNHRTAAMSTKSTRDEALDDISAWGTDEVLALLRKVSEVGRDCASSRRDCRDSSIRDPRFVYRKVFRFFLHA